MSRLSSQPRLVPLESASNLQIGETVARAKAGDLDAWASLYRDHFDPVFRHICYLTGDPESAEDLVQDVFARAMACCDTFEGRAEFGTWLHGIAINIVRGYWRSRRAKKTALDGLKNAATLSVGTGAVAPDRAELRRERTQLLYAVLHELPDKLREAFILLDLEGLQPAEAAKRLDISAGNVSVRAHRARSKIRERLQSLGGLEDPEVLP